MASDESVNIQWYPGHMTKTRRQIEADLKLVDAVCEIVDARIPISSRNPDIDSICANKPRIILLNRMDLADPAATNAANAQRDGSLTMGNLMNAAWSLGVSSCWINRAEEVFAQPGGKALLRRWGLPETLVGVGNCILGYAEGPVPAPKPRKDGYIVRV